MISLLLPPPLVGTLAFLLLITSPLIGVACLMPFALVKRLIPIPAVGRVCRNLAVASAQLWILLNRLVYRLFYPTAWELDLPAGLDPGKSYLMICNHQSWIDILLLAEVFHRRAPFPSFFLKRELLWVPFIGLGCWAMEMPFMKRHSKEALKANPALKREDLETTRRFCERYRDFPVTVVNFVEGTRFNERKRAAFNSPYRHLLRPKSAGLRIALDAMGEQFAGIIDVTIAYRPSKYPVVWSFLRGEQNELALHAELVTVPRDLMTGDYEDDAGFRAHFQTWLNELWARKDAKLDALLARPAAAIRPRTSQGT
jgi:1-acyl-sn-glycerol-3-phosphate acyltransferase